jgi:hypothetical protein
VGAGQLLATFPTRDNVLAIWHPAGGGTHAADAGARKGVPNVYVLELVRPSVAGD